MEAKVTSQAEYLARFYDPASCVIEHVADPERAASLRSNIFAVLRKVVARPNPSPRNGGS